MKRIIERIDSQPPQVVIQVLIADVQLNNAEEFGVEFGLQSPVMFARGRSPADDHPAANAANPGFNFNTTAPLPQQPNLATRGRSASRGSRTSASGELRRPRRASAGSCSRPSSNTFSLLIRALKAQGRMDVLSRPQLQVADNQTGFVQVGQNFPYLGTAR